MAYNQGLPPLQQRPYDGRAAQRPGPGPAQQYPPQNYPQGPGVGGGGYDKYAQDDYGYDNNRPGYGQGQGYDQGYQQPPPNRGRGGQGPPPRGYPPQNQNQNYPPRGQGPGGYGGGGGRGGPDPRFQGRGGRGGPDPYAQAPPRGDSRGYGGGMNGPPPPRGDSRGYQNDGGPPRPNMGRGGRPAPLERAPNSDPGTQNTRRPLIDVVSPKKLSWDTAFPEFPGMKKASLDATLTQQLGAIDINANPDDRENGQGRPPPPSNGQYPPRNGPPGDGYGPPDRDVRGPSAGYPRQGPPQGPPQAYNEPSQGRPGPGPGPQGYDRPRGDSNGYGAGGYSASIPTSPTNGGFDFNPDGRNGEQQYPPIDAPGGSAPYNGPIGRGMTPRPSMATGDRPPPPQRAYTAPQGPPNQGYNDGYGNGDYTYNNNQQQSQFPERGASHHQRDDSVSEVYDAYFDGAPDAHDGSMSADRSRTGELDDLFTPVRQQVGDYQANYQESFDTRAQAQPQTADYGMARSPGLNEHSQNQGYQDDGYNQGQYGGMNRGLPQGPPQGPPQGLPQGPPQNGYANGQDGYEQTPQGYPLPPRSNTGSIGSIGRGPSATPGPVGLPPHPTPYRPGLQPQNGTLANNKPPPVRNYAGSNISEAPTMNSQPSSTSTPAPGPGQPPEPMENTVTYEELESLRASLNNNPTDQQTQLILARKLVLASETLTATIPDAKARGKTREKWVMEAHKHLKKLVALGNTDAMFFLADCYGRGALGLETSPSQAFTLYQSAAKAGHAQAAYRTAVCCEIGQEDGGGTRKDPLKAMQWYKRAATLGDTPAMYKMGMIQLKGLLGQPKNVREAVMWLKRAADRADAENPHALHELALLYQEPQSPDSNVVRDEGYSLSLFRQAAELGYKFSQFRMGAAYEYGLFGLPISPKESIQWYSRAAVQEEHQSELALSGWYLTGAKDDRGQVILAQSDTEAYLWARKAAVAGLAKAEYAMGYFTEMGIGSVRDAEGAKRWYWRAAAQNFPQARERLEELKRGGKALPTRERISRSKVGKQNEGECAVM